MLFNARWYYPVLAVLFLDFGLTIGQYALLNVAWAAAIVGLEVPSGVLADQLGRRRLVVFAAALMVVEMAIFAFVRDGIRQDAVEGADAIRRHEEQMLAEVEDFAHLAAGDFADAGEVEGMDEHGGLQMADRSLLQAPRSRHSQSAVPEARTSTMNLKRL